MRRATIASIIFSFVYLVNQSKLAYSNNDAHNGIDHEMPSIYANDQAKNSATSGPEYPLFNQVFVDAQRSQLEAQRSSNSHENHNDNQASNESEPSADDPLQSSEANLMERRFGLLSGRKNRNYMPSMSDCDKCWASAMDTGHLMPSTSELSNNGHYSSVYGTTPTMPTYYGHPQYESGHSKFGKSSYVSSLKSKLMNKWPSFGSMKSSSPMSSSMTRNYASVAYPWAVGSPLSYNAGEMTPSYSSIDNNLWAMYQQQQQQQQQQQHYQQQQAGRIGEQFQASSSMCLPAPTSSLITYSSVPSTSEADTDSTSRLASPRNSYQS